MTAAIQSGRRSAVLLVDDQPIVAEAIRRMLDGENLEFHFCSDAAKALEVARAVLPAVILQDLVMPGEDGFAQLARLRSDPKCADIPVIVLSSREEPDDKWRAFELGASDYLVKIPHRLELLARVRAHVRSCTMKRERDAAFDALASAQQELEERHAELERVARLDGLTGVANRKWLDEVLSVEWRRCQREGVSLSFLLCDIDHFKLYNDTYGHPAGDACLRQVAATLGMCARRPADLAARYGGEEFALLLPNTPLAGALVVAENVVRAVRAAAIAHAASPVGHVTASVGVAGAVPAREHAQASLLERADGALYRAKHAGRDRVMSA
jgi:two-component system chemotaxis family response regulator WspR